jgi:hypothetical protein
MPHLLKWWRFQKRKEFLLLSYRFQSFAETRDMILGNRFDFIDHDDLAPTPTIAKKYRHEPLRSSYGSGGGPFTPS